MGVIEEYEKNNLTNWFTKLDVQNQVNELEKLFQEDTYEDFSMLFHEMWSDVRRNAYQSNNIEPVINFYQKIKSTYPHARNDLGGYVRMDVYFLLRTLETRDNFGSLDPDKMRNVLDVMMEDMLEDTEYQMIFEILYPAIYYDQFDPIKERMLGRWRTTFQYPPDMLSFYNHYYLIQSLVHVRDEPLDKQEIKNAFHFIEEHRDKLKDLRKYRLWIVGEKSHPWKDRNFDNRRTESWKRNMQLLSYELMHYLDERVEIRAEELEVFRYSMFLLFTTHQSINLGKNDLSRFKPRYKTYMNGLNQPSYDRDEYLKKQGYRILIALKYIPILIDFLIEKKLLREEQRANSYGILHKFLQNCHNWKALRAPHIQAQIPIIRETWKELFSM